MTVFHFLTLLLLLSVLLSSSALFLDYDLKDVYVYASESPEDVTGRRKKESRPFHFCRKSRLRSLRSVFSSSSLLYLEFHSSLSSLLS